jgi:hypothetical protein
MHHGACSHAGGHPVKGAAVCAAIGGATYWAGSKVDLSHGVRGALISMDLLDDVSSHESSQGASAPGQQKTAAGSAEGEAEKGWFERLSPYLPIKKFTDEEWEEYKKKQDEMQQKRWVAPYCLFTTREGLKKVGGACSPGHAH